MFASGLAAGTHESYFPLVEQFMTQSSPPYCGLTTLAMMLNSLNIDPNQRWQGGWRWFNEDMLLGNCCKPRSEVEQDGMTMDEFAGIARCHGAVVECTRASEGGVDAFREQVIEAVSSPSAPLLAASFSRAPLGQTGDGHFSPIAGYDAATDHLLVLDVISTEAQRNVPADGGGGNSCPVAPIRREFCPVPRQGAAARRNTRRNAAAAATS